MFRKYAVPFIYIVSLNPHNNPLRWKMGWYPYFEVMQSWHVVELDSDCDLGLLSHKGLSLTSSQTPEEPCHPHVTDEEAKAQGHVASKRETDPNWGLPTLKPGTVSTESP